MKKLVPKEDLKDSEWAFFHSPTLTLNRSLQMEIHSTCGSGNEKMGDASEDKRRLVGYVNRRSGPLYAEKAIGKKGIIRMIILDGEKDRAIMKERPGVLGWSKQGVLG
ncbi:uncharacterized protein [Rutidosis leptorrhynchoides]|uniref:uncharacterized protein n=1 Tax=Rutidosis leptorrhynchoides TaxID=125765 RepID=UPI003A9A0677